MKSHGLTVRRAGMVRGRMAYQGFGVDFDGVNVKTPGKWTCPLLAAAEVCRGLAGVRVMGTLWTDDEAAAAGCVMMRACTLASTPLVWGKPVRITFDAVATLGKHRGDGWGECPWAVAAEAVRNLLDRVALVRQVNAERAEDEAERNKAGMAGTLWSKA